MSWDLAAQTTTGLDEHDVRAWLEAPENQDSQAVKWFRTNPEIGMYMAASVITAERYSEAWRSHFDTQNKRYAEEQEAWQKKAAERRAEEHAAWMVEEEERRRVKAEADRLARAEKAAQLAARKQELARRETNLRHRPGCRYSLACDAIAHEILRYDDGREE